MAANTTLRSAARRRATAGPAQVIVISLLATTGTVTAQTTNEPLPPASPEAQSPRPAESGWEAHTRVRAPEAGTETPMDSTLDLTVYRGLVDGVTLPGHASPAGRGAPAYATDVTAIITRCADGRQLITALVIGGKLTPLENHCDEPHRDRKPAPKDCDANTWTCR